MQFGILGVPGSNSVRLLLSNINQLRNCRSGLVRANDVDVIINYGLKGQRLDEWFRGNARRRAFQTLPQINGAPAMSKLSAIRLAQNNAVPTPRTYAHNHEVQGDGFIFKPFFSSRGRGIVRMGQEPRDASGYYQQMIRNRRYEVRVVGATWYNEPWAVYKKTPGSDMPAGQIAWNHDQGGVFRRVNDISARVFSECIQYTRTMLTAMGLQFGAADFIVDRDRNIYFIELNMRPGFTADYGVGYYVGMFQRLVEQNNAEVTAILNANTHIDRETAAQRQEREAQAAEAARLAAVEEARIEAERRYENVSVDIGGRLYNLITRWQDDNNVQFHGDIDHVVGAIMAETTI